MTEAAWRHPQPAVAAQRLDARPHVIAFVVLLAGGVVARLARYALEVGGGAADPYVTGDWLINYGGGFVRRGLFGEIALRVSDLMHVSPAWIAFAVPAVAMLWLIAVVARWYLRTDRDPRWLLLLLSPAFLMFWVLSGASILRKEVLAFAALALLIGASHPGARVALRVPAAFALFTFAALSHELAVFIAPFFLYALYLIEQRRGWPRSATIAWGAAVVGVCLIAAAGAFFMRGDAMTAERICAAIVSRGLPLSMCNGSVQWLTRDLAYNVKALGTLYPGYLGYAFLFFLALVPLIAGGWASRHLRLLAIGILVVSPVFVIALDYGRWIHLLVVPCTLLALSEGVVERRPWPPMPLVLVIAFVSTWSLPHYGDPFAAFSLAEVVKLAVEHGIRLISHAG